MSTRDPISQQPPIANWSPSSLRQFESCPYNLWLARVERQPRPDFDDDPKHPLVRGSRIHKEAELYVRGEGPFTSDLRKFRTQFEELRAKYEDGCVSVEQDWGFTIDWQPTEYLGPDCWALIKCDAIVIEDGGVVRVIDYKTGKKFGKEVIHGHQMQAYAVAAAARIPSAKLIVCELWYLDEGKSTIRKYPRPALNPIKERLSKRAVAMTSAIVFPPKPNRGNCRYCDFGTANGTGACAYAVGDSM